MEIFDILKRYYPAMRAYYDFLLPEDENLIFSRCENEIREQAMYDYVEWLCLEPESELNDYFIRTDAATGFDTIDMFLRLFYFVRETEGPLNLPVNAAQLAMDEAASFL